MRFYLYICYLVMQDEADEQTPHFKMGYLERRNWFHQCLHYRDAA